MIDKLKFGIIRSIIFTMAVVTSAAVGIYITEENRVYEIAFIPDPLGKSNQNTNLVDNYNEETN